MSRSRLLSILLTAFGIGTFLIMGRQRKLHTVVARRPVASRIRHA